MIRQKIHKKSILAAIFSVFHIMGLMINTKESLAFRAEGSQVMMVAPSHYAIQTGQAIARKGGNVVDVAVGMALSLAVTSPYYASLGGGGFSLVKMDSHPVEMLDFREMAPQKISSDFFIQNTHSSSTQGGMAVAIPGLPAGLFALHQKYGHLKWKSLFKHPLQLAKNGFHVSGHWARATQEHSKNFNEAGKTYFLKSFSSHAQQKPSSQTTKKTSPSLKSFYKPGELFQQIRLAKALKKFRDKKRKGFYEGAVASDIVQSVQNAGGMISKEDLANYRVRWRKPITTQFEGHKLYFVSLPSSGGVVLKTAFHLVKKWRSRLKLLSPMEIEELHLLGEILSRAFRGRILLGDPDFQAQPSSFHSELLSPSYLHFLTRSIHPHRTRKLSVPKEIKTMKNGNPLFQEKGETTHISVLDIHGNSVAMTLSLNGFYGSGVATKKYGIFLNNHIDDFNTKPGQPNLYGLIQSKQNNMQPKKRPLSSMSPTLVEKKDKIILSTGGAGGPRIISGVFQLIYRVLAQKANVDQAIEFTRVHHQFLPHTLFVDRKTQPATQRGLNKKGHHIKKITHVGWVAAVRLNEEENLEAAYDTFREGAAGGY